MYVLITYPLDDMTDGPNIGVYGPFPTQQEAVSAIPELCYYDEIYYNPADNEEDDWNDYERERLRTPEQIIEEVGFGDSGYGWYNFDTRGMGIHITSISAP